MNIEDIEKQFRAQLENHESFDLDPDLTWKAIETELDKKKPWKGAYLLLLGLGILMSILLFNEKRPSAAHYPGTPQGIITMADELPPALLDEAITTTASSSTITVQATQSAVTFSKYSSSKVPGTGEYDSQQSPIRLQPFTSDTPLPSTSQWLTSKTVAQKRMYPEKSKLDKEQLLNVSATIAEGESTPTTTEVPIIDQLPLECLSPPANSEVFDQSIRQPLEKNQPRYRLEVATKFFQMTNGINASENEYAMLRSQSETPQVSGSLGANLWRTKPSGWLIGLGPEYQESRVRFRYQNQETEPFLSEDIPTHFLIDPETQDTIASHIGTVELEQYYSRDVQHYNTFQTLQLPIHFGFVKETQRKLTYGISAGLSLQYQIRQSGRVLAEDGSITDFTDDSLFRRMGLSTHLQPMFMLKGAGQWEVYCNPFLAFTLTNRMKSSGTTITQRPFTYGLSLGITRAL